MTRRALTALSAAALAFVVPISALGGAARADLPWGDAPAAVVGDVVRAAARGTPDLRAASFDARRRSARRRAEETATAMLHAHVDRVLARLVASPATAERVHRTLERHARVSAVRSLVDGAALVVVSVPRAELRRVFDHAESPW